MKTNRSALRVLVVDDEMLMRWSICEMLKQHGHQVIEAADAASARRALREAPEPLDAVVLDCCLPDSHDLTLLADIRRTTPESSVVLITAFCSQETLDGARDLGAYAIMNKPFDIADLEAVVSEACASRRH